ncbi:DUF2505 domain-containing protein [Sansalvadorimonas verongulae]|uniref:DUF2505 domain-containing protein n=1 Tax=Sansalvadorimonas verongulae TaxID=2172824 RepID=UPI0012BB4AD0|nr:DUF2505 domain-containing protein [Sansalvadorimonas verongulae]MTI15033.1 DUF2505 domain-containing protein [Sansalvadorimonas verongulae]
MRKVTATHSYTIDVDSVFSFFADEERVTAKHETIGARRYRLKSAKETGSTLSIDSRREVPVGQEVPSALRRFTGEWNKVRQRETWTLNDDGSRHCQLRVDLDSLPVKVQGEMRITPTENGCVNNVEIEVSSSLPLVGKLAAEFVGKSIELQMEDEYEYIKGA